MLKPAILALLFVSLTSSFFLLLAIFFALQVVRYWDINSGSELQLRLERRTYLISILLGFCFTAELVSLLLFVFNAESMSGQFVGAMCATGVLNVNGYGWAVLFFKIFIFFFASVWLLLNHVDNLARDYPLVRVKYWLLLAFAPVMLLETLLVFHYFLGLDSDIITSCCGSLFSSDAKGVAAEISGISPVKALGLFATSGILVLLSGLVQRRWKWGGLLYAHQALAAFIAAIVAIPSVIALYIYEHPHHHCPFCIVKPGYNYIGYYIYMALFVATASAFCVGALSLCREKESLQEILPGIAEFFTHLSLVLYVVLYCLVSWVIFHSHLKLMGLW